MSVDVTQIKNLPKIKFISQPESFGSWMVGEIYQQVTPFAWDERDWNHDGDAYALKAARFSKTSQVNPHSPNYFYLSEGDFKDLQWTNCVVYVKEHALNTPAHVPLDDQIAVAERKKGKTENIGSVSYER